MKVSKRSLIGILTRLFVASCLGLAGSMCPGVIVIDGTSMDSEVDPGNGLPLDHIGKLTSADASHASSGSAVYLGGGYLLTANHVSLSEGYVSFDGSSTFAIRSGSGKQVAAGVDLKIFQLTTDPGLSGVTLLPESGAGTENSSLAYLTGWGVGANPGDDFTDSKWDWGSALDTSGKRWGTNWVIGATSSLTYSGYNYSAIATRLGANETPSDTEAAASLFDSGGGLFMSDGNGGWYLMGITTAVSTNGSSLFGVEAHSGGDLNFFARITQYENEIQSEMTDPIPVPEMPRYSLVLGVVFLGLVSIRQRLPAAP